MLLGVVTAGGLCSIIYLYLDEQEAPYFYPITWIVFCSLKLVSCTYLIFFLKCKTFEDQVKSNKLHFYAVCAITLVFFGELIFNLVALIINANYDCDGNEGCSIVNFFAMISIQIPILFYCIFTVIVLGSATRYVWKVQKLFNQLLRSLSETHI